MDIKLESESNIYLNAQQPSTVNKYSHQVESPSEQKNPTVAKCANKQQEVGNTQAEMLTIS